VNIDFYKLHTGKNDLILIDGRHQIIPEPEDLPRLSRGLCQRHNGVGGTQVVFLLPPEDEFQKLRCFRSDGDETNLIADALFCLGRYCFDAALMVQRRVSVEGPGGIHLLEAVDSNNFRISLGIPRTLDLTPLTPHPDTDYTEVISLEQRRVSMIPLFLQRGGAVFLDGGEYRGKRKMITAELRKVFEPHPPLHPVFVTILNRDEIAIDSPLDRLNAAHGISCGLGGAAGVLSTLTNREMVIRSREKRYYFEWTRENEVFLTGSGDYSFSGTYYFEE